MVSSTGLFSFAVVSCVYLLFHGLGHGMKLQVGAYEFSIGPDTM